MKNPIRLDYFFLRLIFGRRWREKLWMTKGEGAKLSGQIAMASAQVLTETYGLKPIKVENRGFNPSSNPGFVKIKESYLMLARSSRLVCYNDIEYIENDQGFADLNFIYTLDKNFQVLNASPLDESLLHEMDPTFHNVIGDVRLFHWQDNLWGIGATARIKDGKQFWSQTLCQIENSKIVKAFFFDSPTGVSLEKNWTPVVQQEDLYFVYSYSPTNILKFANGALTPLKPLRKTKDHSIRGGTPLITYGEHYLGLAHTEPNMWNGKRSYTHCFALFNRDLALLEISEPFYLQRKGIEFAAGICKTDDGILVSYGAAERSCRFMHITDHIIDRYLTI